MKKIISLMLILLLIIQLTGCETVRKKFTRKRKAPVKMPRIYQTKVYEKVPSPELYKVHYAYWLSWQSELVKVLGQNHKKDMRCIEEIIGHLKDMQNILAPEKAAELEGHIEKLASIKDVIFKEELAFANSDYIRRTLEKEERLIKRSFSFDKVKDHLRKSFDDGPS